MILMTFSGRGGALLLLSSSIFVTKFHEIGTRPIPFLFPTYGSSCFSRNDSTGGRCGGLPSGSSHPAGFILLENKRKEKKERSNFLLSFRLFYGFLLKQCARAKKREEGLKKIVFDFFSNVRTPRIGGPPSLGFFLVLFLI